MVKSRLGIYLVDSFDLGDNMSIRLVATDMDGTLLDSNKNKPADFNDWVINHPEIKVVIASGRQYFTLYNDFEEIAEKLIYISDNGGLVFKNGQIIYSNPMQAGDIKECLEKVKNISFITPILCGAKSAYMIHTHDYIEKEGKTYYAHLEFVEDLYSVIDKDIIVKIALFIDDYKAEESMQLMDGLNSRIVPVLSGKSWIDVANASVNKGSALKAILKDQNIKKEESMAFGDYLNDYALLMESGESVVMANGHPKLKAIAKHETSSNDEDGVMKVLRNL